jgi:hypothetical protein
MRLIVPALRVPVTPSVTHGVTTRSVGTIIEHL